MEVDYTEAARAQVMPGEFVDDHESLEEITFGYCTEFIVSHPRPDMRESEVVRLRKRLERIGDCVLVISDLSVVKVHVHTDDPGKALQMALELGELDAIKIDNMREEAPGTPGQSRLRRRPRPPGEEKRYGIVSVALGRGTCPIFSANFTVDKVVDGGQTMNPSIEDIYEAIESTHAQNVYVLPNNTNIILAAQQAAELTERNVMVLPTKSVPMGISAALAFRSRGRAWRKTRARHDGGGGACAHGLHHLRRARHRFRRPRNPRRRHHGPDRQQAAPIWATTCAKWPCISRTKWSTRTRALITVYYGERRVRRGRARQLTARNRREVSRVRRRPCRYGGQPLYYYLIAVE